MSPRTCSHIKSNGSKCGSPALKYHSLCFFHHQWQKRRLTRNYSDMKEGWTTMTLPPLETKASIILAISEIQANLLTGAIDNHMARTLLYGIQLAIQVKANEADLASPEIHALPREILFELKEDREAHRRPPQKVCDSCERADACASSNDCIHSTEQIREFERVHEPERYAHDRDLEENGARRMREAEARDEARKQMLKKTDPEWYERFYGYADRMQSREELSAPAPAPTPNPAPESNHKSLTTNH